MPGPFRIFIGGSELEQWTDATLTRSKDDLTGQLSFSLFMSYMPGSPVATFGAVGNDILVYIGNEIAFTGKVDRRTGTGSKNGNAGTKDTPQRGAHDTGIVGNGAPTGSVSIGPNEYTVKIQARGKSKILVDSSHTHPTGQINKPTTQDVVNKLVENTDITVEWLATPIKLDKVRFRDGATLWEELQRVGNENSYFMYQTRDGKLRVTDDTGRTTGDALILGENILTFSAEQSEDNDRQEIRVKGQRIPKEVWGNDAVIETHKTVTNAISTNKAPVTVQHYGDGTPETLERRAQFEANKRVSASKEVTIEVFHVQASGAPWDIGNVHYVEIPPEGIFDVFECTNLEYTVDAKETLRTKMTLSPMPSGSIAGGSSGSAFGFIGGAIEELLGISLSRKEQFNITVQPGVYPASWGSAELSIVNPLKSLFKPKTDFTTLGLDDEPTLPATLPSIFNEHS